MKKNWIRSCGLGIALAALLAVPGTAEAVPGLLEPVGVKLASAQAYVGDLSKITVYDGAVVPYTEGLSFSTDGTLEEVHAVVGQQVKAGDTLMVLNQKSQRERHEALLEQLDAAEAEQMYADMLADIDRSILELELQAVAAQLPRDDKAIALKRLDIEGFEENLSLENQLREMEIQRLREEIRRLEDEFGDAVLTAPFDGTVMFIANVTQGSRVSAFAPLMYLADETRLAIESAYVSEPTVSAAHDVWALAGDSRVEISMQPLDMDEYLSRILSGDTAVSRFDILENGEGLTAGMYAAVLVETGYIEDALLIPANSLYTDASGKYVYIVENGVRVRRDVETGATTAWEVQIKSGLEEGEIVYVKD